MKISKYRKRCRHPRMEAFTTPNRHNQKRTSLYYLIVKMPRLQYKKRILKAIREKLQLTYKDKPIRITSDILAETLKVRKLWNETFQALRVNTNQDYYIQPTKSWFFEKINKIDKLLAKLTIRN
jgi:hypothetical protein